MSSSNHPNSVPPPPPAGEHEETLNPDQSADEDLNSDCSSDDPNRYSNTLASAAAVTVSVDATPAAVSGAPNGAGTGEDEKPSGYDDSRRLFQRLWTDEDEIKLLQGFLDYTTQRGSHHSSSYHHDTALFYEQIKDRFQLGFNKNQLVEKLRRLKKKYRNAVNRINSGKEYSFKTPHDQTAFEISRKIWSAVGVEEAAPPVVDEEEQKPPVFLSEINENKGFNSSSNVDAVDVSHSEKKVVSRSRKRPRDGAVPPDSNHQNDSCVPNAVEDTMKSCLSPLFQELIYSSINGSFGGSGGLGSWGLNLSPLGLNFVGSGSAKSLAGGEVVEEKWRKQRILELEVYSKRVELIQEQIKLALEELRSVGS